MEGIEEAIATLKECVAFLIEQEELRGKAVATQQEELESLKSTINDQILKPLYDSQYEDGLAEFQDKYGDRLGKFDKVLGRFQEDPEQRDSYSTVKETFDDYVNNEMSKPEEERLSMDDYVAQVEQKAAEFIQGLKADMGLPEDAAIEMKQDAEGNTSVKADMDGDGKPETELVEGSDAESSEPPAPMEWEEDESAEPTEEELDAYLKGADKK